MRRISALVSLFSFKSHWFSIRYCLILSVAANCLDVANVCAQQLSEKDSLFLAAEFLYNLLEPTEDTDKKALENYNNVLKVNQATSSQKNDSLNALCYHRIGAIYQDRGQFSKALINYQSCKAIIDRVFGANDSASFEILVLIGSVHFYQNTYDSAEHYYSLADKIALSHKALEGEDRLYNVLGFFYKSIGNYSQAINYYRKALLSTNKAEVDYKKTVVYFTINIAFAMSNLGMHSEAISLYRNLLEEGIVSSLLYYHLGSAYSAVNDFDSAAFFLRRALNGEDKVVITSASNELGMVYVSRSNLDSARILFLNSISWNKALFNSRNNYLPSSYFGLAQIHCLQNNPDSALHYYQLALINTTFDFNDSTITANPPDITQAISLLQLFDVLTGKAAAWNQYYQQDQDATKLKHSLSTYQLAIRVAQHIQKTYDNDEAKLFLVNKVAPVYEEAIATAAQLHQLTNDPQYVAQAFQFSEASKASVLTESLRDVKIKSSGGVNDSLVQDEHRIKQQITALRLKLVESQDSAQNERYRQQLIDQEIALARTIKYLQKDEHYYQRKYQPDSLDIAALQRSLLSGSETLLEYFVGQQKIYVFALRRDDLRVASVARTAELDSALQRTQRQLYDYRPGQGDDEASLATLYRYLIAPVAEVLADVHKLIIVPDGPLHYLPFDLLSADGQRANYLIHTHTLHYGYSASLLQQAIDERRGYPTEAVLAMAPFTGGVAGNVRSQGFNRLRDSQAEVESVGGSIYTEGRATKRRFLRVAGSYNVLHLATHATVNDEDPSQSFIAFYPQQRDSVANYRLYTHELYNMRLDSVKLVILSACEAGNGQLVRGEGVMSLARAFAYAGCPNTITTLWKADDRSSARLTARLHHYLKQGWEKDEALRQAKLDYLNDPEVHPAQKTPYYWANFVFIGDPAPIYDNYRWWWLAVGLLLVVLVGGLLRWRQEQRRAKQTA